MPELLSTRLAARLRRMTLSLLCALPLCALPAGAWGQGTPAGLRACAAQTDPGRRLACYDREMGRPAAAAAHATPAAPGSAPAPAPARASPEPRAHAAAPVPHHDVGMSSAPKAAASEDAPSRHTSRWKILSAVSGGDWHVTAQVSRLTRSPDSLVLYLDNGQVWRQVARAPGDLSLHEGDSVTIEKHLGSYWLSARHVSNMKVRQEPQS